MVKLQNYQNGEQINDYLIRSSNAEGRCPANACLGSLMNTSATSQPKSTNEIKSQAKDFIQLYYQSLKESDAEKHLNRWKDIESQIENFGTYDMTDEELVFGAKLAWRNVARCIGRTHWNKLDVFDMRHITTTKEMFDAVCHHMKWATEEGQIKVGITIFPHRKPGMGDFRIWNSQIVAYAGYRNDDGTFTGDPSNVEFTEVCIKLGWKSKRSNFDILPLLLSVKGEDPEMFEVPDECARRIKITHPKYPKLSDLQLEWYASPAISGMMLDIGGVEFPSAPFNGWYIGTEIGCRNFADTYRYNLLEVIAQKIGLDTKNPTTLWKDQALVEINFAVLDSFQKHGVTIMDHHTATETFMRHFETENKVRGGCPADWVWLVPPMSGSLTPVFHQEMALYSLRPSFEYQEPAWRTHVSSKNPLLNAKPISNKLEKHSFKAVALLVLFTIKLFRARLLKREKVTILYASETGKSTAFAHQLRETFNLRFNPKVQSMDEYNFSQISNEKMIIIIASTFGNGDPPDNGKSFYQSLQKIKNLQEKDSSINEDKDIAPLSKVKFSVFALGNSAYPNYCGFGKNVDKLLGDLGANRLLDMTRGNELDGQEESFQNWSVDIYMRASKALAVDYNKSLIDCVNKSIINRKSSTVVSRMNSTNMTMESEAQEFARLHNRQVTQYKLLERNELHEPYETYSSLQIILQAVNGNDVINYQAGDHIGIFPKNSEVDCIYIYCRLINKPKGDGAIVVEFKDTNDKKWKINDRLPKGSLMEMLKSFIDITTPCRQEVLKYFASCTDNEKEKEILLTLGKNKKIFEKWKQWYSPTLASTLKQFPSVKPDATTLISKLPLMQPRFYSASSSSLLFPNEIHLTVSVLKYDTQNGSGPLHLGVCSNYLNDIPEGSSVSCFLRSTPSFRLPEDITAPLIFIGAGTGIAPLRGLWQQRQLLMANNNTKFGSLDLYFGCRNSQTILYKDELFEMMNGSDLTKVYVAMSRENSLDKTYVQDLLVQNKERVLKQIVDEGAHIYICGNCSMAEEVLSTITTLIRENGLNEVEAEKYVTSLKSQKRYHVDIFSSTHKKATVVGKSPLFSFIDNI